MPAVLLFLTLLPSPKLHASNSTHSLIVVQQDTTEEKEVSIEAIKKINTLNTKKLTIDTVNLSVIKANPYVHIGDYLKGQASGVLVQSPTAEPGSYQNIVIRGLSRPQLSNNDINSNIAAVYVNGIPMALDHNFSKDLQRYDLTRLGASTDYYSSIDLSTVQSIEIIKDPVRLSELGPLATNGAIWITTYGGLSSTRLISINSYMGFNTKPQITPVNADFENRFRRQFYNRYPSTDPNVESRYPGYLSDSTNVNYYGPANWMDRYFSNSMLSNLDLSIKGGTSRANFGFMAGFTNNASASDDTQMKKYNVLLNINMLPFEWMNISTYLNGRRSSRDRNRNIRDRLLEMAYYPDLSTPISPNTQVYSDFISRYDRTVLDDNVINNFQGNIKLDADIIEGLKFTTNFMIDYSEGRRDLFYPKDLMETINYQSGFINYSQRYIFSNALAYNFNTGKNEFKFKVGTDYQQDLYRFYFARAFDGPNDYIKLNIVQSDPNKGDYLLPRGDLKVSRWNGQESYHMQSFYGTANYIYDDTFDFKAVIRWDGASTIQKDSRWMLTPAFSASWNLAKTLESKEDFKVRASYGRIALPNYNSRYAMGPQYSGNSLGILEDPTISSYYGFVGLTRSYKNGWIGYNLNWAYSDKYELAIEKSLLDSRINTMLAFYQTYDRNQIIGVPVPGEFGFSSQFKNGLEVKNMGFDANLNIKVLDTKEDRLSWTTSLNFNFNKNELTKLPDNLNELIIGDRILKVGHAIDSYWLYENLGIYNNAGEIPTLGGSLLSVDGLEFTVGDAIWKDQDGNGIINTDDKVIKGRSTPNFFGGFNNSFSYKKFQLDLGIIYALGQKVLNQRASNRYNFISNESSNSIFAVREIFNWQNDIDLDKYPIYNVWSNTNPYRLDQDLFLENASYLKLRSVTLGYDLSNLGVVSRLIPTVRRAYVYVNGNNLFTLTPFSGNDPELINFNGYYDAYGMQFSRSFTLGIKLDL